MRSWLRQEEQIPLRDQVRLLLRQALLGPESPPEHVHDEEIAERSRQRAEVRARQLARLHDAERGEQTAERSEP